jgi:hypothetical protein
LTVALPDGTNQPPPDDKENDLHMVAIYSIIRRWAATWILPLVKIKQAD